MGSEEGRGREGMTRVVIELSDEQLEWLEEYLKRRAMMAEIGYITLDMSDGILAAIWVTATGDDDRDQNTS